MDNISLHFLIPSPFPLNFFILYPFSYSPAASRGKIKSQGANKLQRPFLANSIYCSDPISNMLKTAA